MSEWVALIAGVGLWLVAASAIALLLGILIALSD